MAGKSTGAHVSSETLDALKGAYCAMATAIESDANEMRTALSAFDENGGVITGDDAVARAIQDQVKQIKSAMDDMDVIVHHMASFGKDLATKIDDANKFVAKRAEEAANALHAAAVKVKQENNQA